MLLICASAFFRFVMLNSPRLDFVFCICLHFPFGEGLYAPALLFSSARVLFHFSYLIPPLPLFPPLFPWLGAIRSRAAVFDLRVCFSISHISLFLFFFFFPYMHPLFPRLGVIRSRAAVFHLRACVFHFPDITLTLLLFLPPICLHSSLG